MKSECNLWAIRTFWIWRDQRARLSSSNKRFCPTQWLQSVSCPACWRRDTQSPVIVSRKTDFIKYIWIDYVATGTFVKFPRTCCSLCLHVASLADFANAVRSSEFVLFLDFQVWIFLKSLWKRLVEDVSPYEFIMGPLKLHQIMAVTRGTENPVLHWMWFHCGFSSSLMQEHEAAGLCFWFFSII